MHTTVSYGQQSVKLPLLVIEGTGATLMGLNRLEHIKLNWNNIHKVNPDHLQTVLAQHSDVFQQELGMIKDFKAKIFVDPTVPPRFCKARSVPYAKRSLVEMELDKLVDQGILTPVKHADRVALIVPVMKADKNRYAFQTDGE